MSWSDEEESNAFIAMDDVLPQFTAETVKQALAGFELSLCDQTDHEWLAMATRRALAISQPSWEKRANRLSDADLRRQLEDLRQLTQTVWRQLFELNPEIDSRLWRYAFEIWVADQEETRAPGTLESGQPPDYVRFRKAIYELDWTSSFLRNAVRSIETRPGPWKTSIKRRVRIDRARYLAPVFERAFNETVTVNKYPSDRRHHKPTPFMDFYQLMVCIGFDEKATPDLAGVIQAARKLHLKHPVEFAENVIPGL